MALTRGEDATTRSLTPEVYVQQLIPGIPNEITLDQITTKLSWRDIRLLSAVSHGWCEVVRSRQVYQARVRSHSIETCVVSGCSVWFMRDNSCHELPRITSGNDRQIHYRWSRLVTFDGKVYVLWGAAWQSDSRVYVFDLAGQQHWKQCANMQQKSIKAFESGVLNGKIYVFGTMDIEARYGSEVYDPKENTWSPIKPTPTLRQGFEVAAVGDELALFRGRYFAGEPREWFTLQGKILSCANFVEFYNPIKDVWRVVKCFERHLEKLFVAQGKFYSTDCRHEIHVYDVLGNSWVHLHSFSFAAIGPPDPLVLDFNGVEYCEEVQARKILAVDDELFAHVEWPTEEHMESCLVRSRGFGSQSKELVWQKVGFSLNRSPLRIGQFIHTFQI